MLAEAEGHLYTLEEYLALEEKAEYKSEYHQGKIMAMAGASANHNRIAGNVFNAISNTIESKPCEAFMSDLRLWVEQKELVAYPDVMVVCGGLKFIEGRTDTITNPKVIIGVLSKSTTGFDKGDKFYAYWTLDTFEECVFVDQYQMRVECFRRADEKMWGLQVFTKPGNLLRLSSIGVDIPLDKIYRNVAWDKAFGP